MPFLHRKPRIRRPKVVMTLLVRNEADIIDLFIRHHTRMGIDALIVTDHGSCDGTREILEQHRRDGAIAEIIDEPGRSYDQVSFVHRMICRAASFYKADYCINSDADEFWHVAGGSFSEELARSRASKIICPSHNMLPSAGDAFWGATDCSVNRADPEKFDLTGYYNLFDEPTHRAKVIHRTEGYRMIKMGNHDVLMDNRIRERSKAIRIYHYSVRSVDQFTKKIIEGGEAIEANPKATQEEGKHWRHLYRRYKADALDLTREFYRVIAAAQIEKLRNAGVVIHDATMKSILEPLVPRDLSNKRSGPASVDRVGETRLSASGMILGNKGCA